MIRILKILLPGLLLLTSNLKGQIFTSSSVLSAGKWFKMAVTEDGIYRIDFAELKKLGLENPSNPQVFGNNQGQLSYYNDNSGPDDLRELAIYTENGSDGVFNEGDFLLFYGKGTGRWIFDQAAGDFNYLRHNYSDTAYYFITSASVAGKRIGQAEEPRRPVNYFSNSSDALFIHEVEAENLIHSGREWFQPVINARDTEIDPGFTDIIASEPVYYTVRVLARASVNTSFSFFENGVLLKNIPVNQVNLASSTGTYAQISSATGSVLPRSSTPVYSIKFLDKGEISAKGWLDYVKLHARRLNSFDGMTTQFTDARSAGAGNITEFTVRSTVDRVMIWDITDYCHIKILHYDKSGENLKFKIATDTMRTFTSFLIKNAKVPLINTHPLVHQDLHASEPSDMIIVTHPLFKKYASELVKIHSDDNGLKSLIVTTGQIYNEFSGGIPDIAAIRNFIRMKYLAQRSTNHPLKYLLLFGDGSYDNRIPPPGNPNFVPTYQSQNSNIVVSSFTSDDFYGLLDDGDGEETGTEDIGIGRIPAADTSGASVLIAKIKGYLAKSNTGDWKNVVCITADDEDDNIHMSDAEGLATMLKDSVPWINVDKIYFDAFPEVISATGQFYPGVTQAINDRINSGALIFNYIGHGNENSLGHERVVTTESIGQWKNKSKLPLIITATCEFSRFDDINKNDMTGEITGKNSAGEKLLFSPGGGGIALMSTTRLVYSAPNFTLNRNILDVAFDNDPYANSLCFGDIIRKAKNLSGNETNKRNFVLLGDPALRLLYPYHGNVLTDSVNHISVGQTNDTIKALSLVSVAGHIEDTQGNPENNFNGKIAVTVFGKPVVITTLANDGGQKMEFSLNKNLLFNGTIVATGGRFKFKFIVPADIDYNYGLGKISYYAYDGITDMKGSFNSLMVGGFTSVSKTDTAGPVINLFLNDTLFRSGGITDRNPKLYAVIEDKGGINATGSGIGHDLICWFDNDRSTSFILNNYFENDIGNYSKGKVIYGFSDLTPGKHILSLKAWDNYNNSSEKSIMFLVDDRGKFILKNILNYPNPFINNTNVSAEHNRADNLFFITIEIYNMNGQIIRILKTSDLSTGFRMAPVEWDGKDSGGRKMGRGIYPFKVSIMTETGERASGSGRMIIL